MSYLLKSVLLLVAWAVMLVGQPALAVVSLGESFGKSDSLRSSRTPPDPGDYRLVHSRPYGEVLESLVAQEIRAMKRVFKPFQDQPADGSPALRPSAEVIESQSLILDLP